MKDHTESISLAVAENILQRPKLYKFLKKLQDIACDIYGEIPYELIEKLFWPALQNLTFRQRNIIVDDLLLNLSGKQFCEKYGIKMGTLHALKKKAKKSLNYFIFNHLEVEIAVSDIKKKRA